MNIDHTLFDISPLRRALKVINFFFYSCVAYLHFINMESGDGICLKAVILPHEEV